MALFIKSATSAVNLAQILLPRMILSISFWEQCSHAPSLFAPLVFIFGFLGSSSFLGLSSFLGSLYFWGAFIFGVIFIFLVVFGSSLFSGLSLFLGFSSLIVQCLPTLISISLDIAISQSITDKQTHRQQ